MRLDDLPRSDNVEDRRGQDSGAGGFRVPGGRGGLGIGTIVILGLIGYWLGIDPKLLIGGAEILSGGGSSQQQSYPGADDGAGSRNTQTGAPSDQTGQFVSAVLGSTEVQWQKIFAQYGKVYQAPTLVMFSGATRSACGFAQSAMGPFYCPNDRKVYLDTSFFRDLERRFRACDVGSKACQFSQAYVIAHEVGHHVQNSARNSAQSPGSEARNGQSGCERSPSADRTASRLPCRSMGVPLAANMEIYRTRRRRSCDANCGGYRRRPATTAGTGLCSARLFHARLLGTEDTLVHLRADLWEDRELRHLQRGAVVNGTHAPSTCSRGRIFCGS